MALLKSKNKNFKKSFWGRWFIPLTLLLFWLILSGRNMVQNLGTTVLTYSHNADEIVKIYTELHSGQKIKGEFLGRDDNLGIVAVRFNTFFRINEDVVIFRIKEKGAKNWYYQYEYTTPQFQPNDFFTFGFPIIPTSKDKVYLFEIESRQGEKGNAVALSKIEPVYITKYQYSKDLILKDIRYAGTFIFRKSGDILGYAGNFLVHKTVNTFTNYDFLISFIAYSLPFFLYLFWLFFFDKYLYDKFSLLFIPIILMIGSGMVNITSNDALVLGLAILWVAMSYAYKLKSNVSFGLALVFIIISAMLYYASLDVLSRNLTMWGFMLMAIGIFQSMIELKWSGKKKIGMAELRNIYFQKNNN